MNRVTVNINGIDYNLKGRENNEYLKYLASFVDEKVKEITDMNNKLSYSAATVLVAINLADEMFKEKKSYEELKVKMDSIEKNKEQDKEVALYIKETNVKLEETNKELEERNEALIKELAEVRAELEMLKANPINSNSEEEILKLKETNSLLEEDAKRLASENTNLKAVNKELKFRVQTYKYKTMDLQKKYMDSQLALAKEKVEKNPLLNIENVK